ncbi:hypothetical protein BpHYR1_039766 [Brachionus plicatilis]|uniref:Uncharacterized protein n=1 Tax=Brachionus plicatilis TaxID=10195 RepID=A0A3M7SKS6_BRAPC|nr:hypothetical protein BpHYR1_039766 [Brachionus plicatilis]
MTEIITQTLFSNSWLVKNVNTIWIQILNQKVVFFLVISSRNKKFDLDPCLNNSYFRYPKTGSANPNPSFNSNTLMFLGNV